MDARPAHLVTPVIPGLEFLDRIGEGGIADVWRARWEGVAPYTGESAPSLVAVKVLREPTHTTLLRRFLREGQILQRLRLPGLVRCFHVVVDPQPALILELLEGESLDRRIARGPLPQAEARGLAEQMLSSLMRLHDQGIIHRDFKASNIWVVAPSPGAGPEPKVVLVDLGLAVDPTDPLTSTLGVVVGTHSYMAPEQISGATVDLRADLYALGITLYEALCGQRPYQARGQAGYLQAHRSGRAAPIATRCADIDPRFAGCVDRLLARDPADRPASAAEALALLNLPPPPVGARTLYAPPNPVGREAVRGALLGALHGSPGADFGGGLVQIIGAAGSGLKAAAEQARQVATREGVEHVSLQLAPNATPDWVVRELCRCLDGWAGAVSPTTASVTAALSALAEQARGRHQVMLILEGLSPDRAGPSAGSRAGSGLELSAQSDIITWIAALRLALPSVVVVVTQAQVPGAQVPGAQVPGAQVDLRPLTLEETATVVALMLGTPAPPIGLAAAVHAATGGLSGLVVTGLQRMAATGALACTGSDESGAAHWDWDARYPRLRTGLGTPNALRNMEQSEPSLPQIYDDLTTRSWQELQSVLEREEPAREHPLHILVETEALLYYGRPVPPRRIDAARSLGGEWSTGRAWVLALRAMRQGDEAAARRRLQRVVSALPLPMGAGDSTSDGSRRLSAEAVIALTDLDWRAGKHPILPDLDPPDPNFPDLYRAKLRVLFAGRRATTLALAAAVKAIAEARIELKRVPYSPVHTLLELIWTEVLLRVGNIDEVAGRMNALARAAQPDSPYAIRARLALLLSRLRRLQHDPASAHAVHLRAEEDAARADDLPLRAYHSGMASVLTGDVQAAIVSAGRLDAPTVAQLRADLLTVCARTSRDSGLFRLAEASARASGDRTLLLQLLYSVRGPGARKEASEVVTEAVEDLYSPLREAFLALPEVQWARSEGE